MKKRLILHIGMHKTGTSSVQHYFSRNRAILRRMGVCYPKSIGADGARQPKHAAMFDAISHEADHGAASPDLGPSAALIDKAAAEIEAAPGRIGVISAEGLSGERPVFAQSLASLGDRFDATVVMFVRRQDLWVESFYKQMVLSRQVREVRSFHDFLASSEVRKHMDYFAIHEWWCSCFDDVRVYGFHRGGPLRPLARLMDCAGMGRRFLWMPFAHAHENPSPGAVAVEMVRRWNEKGIDAPRDIASRIEARLGVSDVRYLTQEERLDLLDAFDDGNQKLLSLMPKSDHSCMKPIAAEMGRSQPMKWHADNLAQIWSYSPSDF